MKLRANSILYLIFSGVVGALFCFSYHFSQIKPRDYKKWKLLLDETSAKKEETVVQQGRNKVSKELFFSSENGIQYIRIDTKESLLQLLVQEKEADIEEYYHGNLALIQEKCYYTDKGEAEQLIHLLQTDRAFVDYTEKKLTAADVAIYSYCLPGHNPPTHVTGEPYMRAKAKNLTLIFADKTPHLHCEQFIASLGTSEAVHDRYLTAPLMSYRFKEDRMVLEGTDKELVYFYDRSDERSMAAHKIEGESLHKREQQRWHATEGIHLMMNDEILEKIKTQLR